MRYQDLPCAHAGHRFSSVMFSRHAITIAAFIIAIPVAGFGQPLNPRSLAPTGNPAGMTLVPGSVAIPAVSGAANTGTIPLPGTAGSLEVPTTPDPGVSRALYPPAYYYSVPNPVPSQSTLPPGSAPLQPPASTTPPTGGIPTCLNVRYSYLCRQ